MQLDQLNRNNEAHIVGFLDETEAEDVEHELVEVPGDLMEHQSLRAVLDDELLTDVKQVKIKYKKLNQI